jgi:hypothetical protein
MPGISATEFGGVPTLTGTPRKFVHSLGMPRYFFDLIEDAAVFPDEGGEVYEDIETMKQEAARTVAEMVRDRLRAFEPYNLGIQIRDEGGTSILKASLVFKPSELEN